MRRLLILALLSAFAVSANAQKSKLIGEGLQ